MVQTLKDRIAYHRSFSLADRWEKGKEKAARWVAYRLPQRVRGWVIIHRHAEMSRGDTHPDIVKAFDLYFKD